MLFYLRAILDVTYKPGCFTGGHNWLLKYRDKLPMTMTLLRKKNLIK
jgi:hypothetical protein